MALKYGFTEHEGARRSLTAGMELDQNLNVKPRLCVTADFTSCGRVQRDKQEWDSLDHWSFVLRLIRVKLRSL